jgi:hypothetical protein
MVIYQRKSKKQKTQNIDQQYIGLLGHKHKKAIFL